jgi:hypothetical protein
VCLRAWIDVRPNGPPLAFQLFARQAIPDLFAQVTGRVEDV